MTSPVQFATASDFGAIPDTGKDSTEAVRKAIRHCKENGIRKLVFEKGRYDFKHPSFLEQYDLAMKQGVPMDLCQSTERKVIAFQLEEMNDFEWDGGFSQFVFHGLVQPFSCVRCSNLTLGRFSIDWEQPLFSQGVVASADEKSAVIEISKGLAAVDGLVPVAALMNIDPDSEYPLIGTVESFYQINRTEQLASDRLRIHYEKPQRLQLGMHLLLRHILNYRMGVLLYECSFVEVIDVVLLYVPGMGIIGHRSENLKFIRLNVKPGEGRVLSTNTDATHFISCKGNIRFEDCYFEGMGDDAVNVHGFYYRIRKIIDPYTVEVFVDIDAQSEQLEFPDAGDRMEWVRGDSLKPYVANEVAEVTVGLDANIRIRFRSPLPEQLTNTDLLANSTRAASLKILNCTVRNNRARAFLVQTRDVDIENCTFDHCTGTAIHVNCSVNWYESMSVNRVSIRNNRFRECGFGAGTIGGAEAMSVGAESSEFVVGVHSDIRFQGNVIHGRGGLGLRIECSEGVLVEGNEFYSSSPIAFIDHSQDVWIQNNRYNDKRAQIAVGKGCIEKSIKLRDEACEIKRLT